MDREIKFRGWFQGINGQEYWAYGYLVKQENGNWEITNGETSWTVDNVGQFTGLLDKNGKEIYEGDVVEYGSCEMQVVYRFNRFIFEGIKDKEQGISIVTGYEKFEIIGNIYEPPPYIGTK